MDFVISTVAFNSSNNIFNLRESDEDSNHVQPCYDEDSPGKAGVGAEGMHHCSAPKGKLSFIKPVSASQGIIGPVHS